MKLYLEKNYDVIFQFCDLVLYTSLLGNDSQTSSLY